MRNIPIKVPVFIPYVSPDFPVPYVPPVVDEQEMDAVEQPVATDEAKPKKSK